MINRKLTKVLSQVQKLSKVDQAILMGKISAMIKENTDAGKSIRLTELSALGAEIWHGIGIDKYIDEERRW